MSATGTVERVCDLLTLIRKKSRTAVEIEELWQFAVSRQTIKDYLKAMHEEGLIFISDYIRKPGQRGSNSAVFTWQPEPFMFPDFIREAANE